MSILSTLKVDDNIQQENDYVGGSLLESGIYDFIIEVCYLDKSRSGAASFNVHLKDVNTDKVLRQTFYITSGTAKGCLPYYIKKNGDKAYLPGFNSALSLSQLSCGKSLDELSTEEKVIKLYDYEAKAEVPTKVEMVMDLLGCKIKAGVLKVTVSKRTKQGDDYVSTGETRDINEVDKFFAAESGMTMTEMKAEAEEANYIKVWEEKNAGITRDKTDKEAGPAAKSGAPSKPASPAKPKGKSIFDGE